ncbi:MAG: beta-lactamase family protein [Gemmatimonadota bacterium]|nr:beta-lactamase family protein [Gemmatimonadota bacterium]
MPHARLSTIIRASLLGATACAPAATPAALRAPPPTAAVIDSLARRLFALNAAPGVGLVVVRDTQVIYSKGFGYADVERQRAFGSETEFYIASATKAFTGMAAAVLAERGAWSLDSALSRYLPRVQLKSPLNADSITIRSLLTHTHGIGNNGPLTLRLAYTGEYSGDDELIGFLRGHPAASTGRAFAYGNIGYNVVGLAMDAVTGRSWRETLEDVLFIPLGMRSTTPYVSRVSPDRLAMPYRATPTGFVPMHYGKTDANMQSAGGLLTTLSDMARWLEANIDGGRIDGRQVLPAAAVAQAHGLAATSSQRGKGLFPQIGYGLGWEISLLGDDTLLVHGGGFPGFATHMSFLPKQRLGVAVFANEGDLGSGFVQILARAVYAVARGEPPIGSDSLPVLGQRLEGRRRAIGADIARRAARSQVLPFPLDAYVGTYVNPVWGHLQLLLVDGKLQARMGAAASAVEVFDAPKNQLRVELFGVGEVVSVGMAGGRADTLSLSGAAYQRVP